MASDSPPWMRIYNAASPAQQVKWATAYGNAVTKVKFVNGNPVVPRANDGPVPLMLATELTLARSGAIDADLSGTQRWNARPEGPRRPRGRWRRNGTRPGPQARNSPAEGARLTGSRLAAFRGMCGTGRPVGPVRMRGRQWSRT